MYSLEKDIKNWEFTHILPLSVPTKKYKYGYVIEHTLFISNYTMLKYVDCDTINTLILDRGLEPNANIINSKFPYLCRIVGTNLPKDIRCPWQHQYTPQDSPVKHFATVRYNKFHPDMGTPLWTPLLNIVNCENYIIPKEAVMVSIKSSTIMNNVYTSVQYLEIYKDEWVNLSIHFPNIKILCLRDYVGSLDDVYFINYKNLQHLSLINCTITSSKSRGIFKFDSISMYKCNGKVNDDLYDKKII